tara:strand:+ start:118 stop:588 length:471 start_codon:yes stop_codon:yes gene_type:complete
MNLKINRVVKNWSYSNQIKIDDGNFIPNGFGRKFKIQENVNHWEDAFKCFNLIPKAVEPLFKNFLGCNYLEGAEVHEHMDSAPKGFVHTRCNLMIKKPKEGGNPVIDGKEIDVQNNDLWLCLASLEKHKTTPVKKGERIIFSFGGLVPINQLENII